VSSLKKLGEDGDIAISCAKEGVMRLFKLTRMNKVFRMYKTEKEAVEALL
jgi:anti-anti-sigma regulatory factor